MNNTNSLLRTILFLDVIESGALPNLGSILLILLVCSPFLILYAIGKAAFMAQQKRDLYPEEIADMANKRRDPSARQRLADDYYDSFAWREELDRRRCVARFQTKPM